MAKTKPKPEIVDVCEGRKVLDCNRCPKLVASRSGIVNGFGPEQPLLGFIGEGPGAVEDDKLRPFIGPAGQTARRWLEELGVNASRDVYWDNVVRCRPPKNRTPNDGEIKACRAHLFTALQDRKPALLVAAGNSATFALLGPIAKQGITRLRGHVFWSEEFGCKVVPMLHPSAVLHDFSWEPFCTFDLRKAIEEAKRPDVMPPGLGDYVTCESVADVEALAEHLLASSCFSFDLETSGLNWRNEAVLCAQFSNKPGTGWIVPLRGQYLREVWTQHQYAQVTNLLKEILESDVPKVAQNGKFDVHFCRDQLGIRVREFAFDTMLAFHLIFEDASHSLESMRSLFTTMPYYDGLVIEQSKDKTAMAEVEDEVLHEYGGADADATLRCARKLNDLLDEQGEGVRWVFENIAMPLQEAVMEMEEHGVLIDPVLQEQVVAETDRLIRQTETVFFGLLPRGYDAKTFNYGSFQQLQKLLYVDLKLPKPPVLTDSGDACEVCKRGKVKEQHFYHTSTGKDALEELEGAHPIIEPLHDLKSLTKLRNSFLLGTSGKETGLLQFVQDDGRIHTTYRVDGTETGRISSSPNLQNIPKYTPERPSIYEHVRRLFTVPEGCVMLEADYSQMELRIMAYMAKDEKLIAMLEGGADLHLYIARHALFKKVDSDLPDDEWRKRHPDLRDKAKCMSPDTRVLTADLRWVPLAEIKDGDRLMAFDEEPQDSPTGRRRLRPTTVISAWKARKPLYEVEFDDGTVLKVTDDHPFLTERASSDNARNRAWRSISTGLRRGLKMFDPWEEDTSKEAGWLAGLFDGEGSLGRIPGNGLFNVHLSQNEGPVLDRAWQVLAKRGFELRIGTKRGQGRSCFLSGGLRERLRFLGTIRPGRLLQAVSEASALGQAPLGCKGRRSNRKEIVRITSVGVGDVVSLETESHTFIAEGFAVHNTFNFGLGYGMTEWSVARRFKCTIEEARSMIANFMSLFPTLQDYFRRIRTRVKRDHFVENCFGRRRHFYGVDTMKDFRGYKRQMGHIMRSAYNFPIQSSASDVHSLSTIAINEDEWLREIGVHTVLSVHDSLCFEVPKEHVQEVAAYIKNIMETIPRDRLGWKLPVELKAGPRWGEYDEKLLKAA